MIQKKAHRIISLFVILAMTINVASPFFGYAGMMEHCDEMSHNESMNMDHHADMDSHHDMNHMMDCCENEQTEVPGDATSTALEVCEMTIYCDCDFSSDLINQAAPVPHTFVTTLFWKTTTLEVIPVFKKEQSPPPPWNRGNYSSQFLFIEHEAFLI